MDNIIEAKIDAGQALNREEQEYWYLHGNWCFPPPPVCTLCWNNWDWITFVHSHGAWLHREM